MNSKEILNNLLTDLYTAYNPADLERVPELVERFDQIAFNAVDMIFLRYNRKTASFYNPEYDTFDFKFNLIKEYEKGNRIFEGKRFVDSQTEEKINTEFVTKQSEKIKEEFSKVIDDLKIDFAKKQEDIIKNYNENIKRLEEKTGTIQQTKFEGIYEGIDIKIQCNYTDKEIKLPKKETLVGLGIGTRIVVYAVDRTIVPLIVEDIFYDIVSREKPVIEVTLKKG